ncbi:HU family DNA-binding protein [Hyphomonadaceae bacterium ML37]|nr:HU family DNA-binding protein [Hyphomonadaceae bacterium ML37]
MSQQIYVEGVRTKPFQPDLSWLRAMSNVRGATVLKSQLITRVAELNPHWTRAEIDLAVRTIFEAIAHKLAEGGRVELRGFGAFTVRQRDARHGRNPRTGEVIDVKAKSIPCFKPGNEMRRRLNSKGR